MQKWEYLIVIADGPIRFNPRVFSVNGEKPNTEIHFNEYLQEIGEVGWELTGTRPDVYIFKRPKKSN